MRHLVCILMLSFVLGGCFCSCRTQYIPIESVKTEYNVRDSIRYDSIYQHDSVYLTVKEIRYISININICISTNM